MKKGSDVLLKYCCNIVKQIPIEAFYLKKSASKVKIKKILQRPELKINLYL